MATESTMLALGSEAPDFSLPDVVSGKTVSLSEFSGEQALLVMFICPALPLRQARRAGTGRPGPRLWG